MEAGARSPDAIRGASACAPGMVRFGFVEPCSIGSSMVLVKVIEGQSAATRIAQVVVFALTRALLVVDGHGLSRRGPGCRSPVWRWSG